MKGEQKRASETTSVLSDGDGTVVRQTRRVRRNGAVPRSAVGDVVSGASLPSAVPPLPPSRAFLRGPLAGGWLVDAREHVACVGVAESSFVSLSDLA